MSKKQAPAASEAQTPKKKGRSEPKTQRLTVPRDPAEEWMGGRFFWVISHVRDNPFPQDPVPDEVFRDQSVYLGDWAEQNPEQAAEYLRQVKAYVERICQSLNQRPAIQPKERE